MELEHTNELLFDPMMNMELFLDARVNIPRSFCLSLSGEWRQPNVVQSEADWYILAGADSGMGLFVCKGLIFYPCMRLLVFLSCRPPALLNFPHH